MLLRRGSQILSDLFPDLLDDLVVCGAPVWKDGDLSKIDMSFRGHRIVRSGRFADSPVDNILQPQSSISGIPCPATGPGSRERGDAGPAMSSI